MWEFPQTIGSKIKQYTISSRTDLMQTVTDLFLQFEIYEEEIIFDSLKNLQKKPSFWVFENRF